MFLSLLSMLAEQPGLLLTAYWAGLIIGGGLILLSMIGALEHGSAIDADSGLHLDTAAGGDFDVDAAHVDADFGVDVPHADVDVGWDAAHVGVDHAAHAAGGATVLANWFSLRFLVFFAAMFGATGVIFSYLSELSAKPIFIMALLAGLVVGQSVHQIFRLIRRTSGDSTPRAADYVNRLASVTIPISGESTGEVALQVRGTQRFVPAVAAGDAMLKAGDEVVVVGYRAGVAQVLSRGEFERQVREKQGETA